MDEEGNRTTYSVEAYKQAIAGEFEDDAARDIAGLSYFLTEEEREKADYDLRVTFNNTLDNSEPSFIKSEDEHDHDETVRTTPTGLETTDEDFSLPKTAESGADSYAIYTGINHLSECGTYEAVEGSTATSRKKAYAQFLSNLRSNNLLKDGEDTTDIEGLSYYRLERKSAYESAVINKLTETFAYEEEQKLKANDYRWVQDKLSTTYTTQKASYEKDPEGYETQLDSVSDTSFLFYAPDNYGFVINILLPFSASQKNKLTNSENDEGKDTKFLARAALLPNVKATDQRGTWFTGQDDYSFVSEDGYQGTLANAAERKYLFFEDCIADADGNTSSRYQPIKNYYGKYTYNGTVEIKKEDADGHKTYKLTPKPIGINDFIGEMEGYLNSVLGAGKAHGSYTPNYYEQTEFTDPVSGAVDYEKFIYYKGSVDADIDLGEIFKFGSDANKALSVINELSFAYNTDTAGLNTYLGYAVSPYTTDFVKEFEAAAQIAVESGAGSYVVAPSDYGWHIMYCTFSYKDAYESGVSVYEFKPADVATEGTFSNLYFEALKSSAVSNKSNIERTRAVNKYVEDCKQVYQERYEDLRSLG